MADVKFPQKPTLGKTAEVLSCFLSSQGQKGLSRTQKEYQGPMWYTLCFSVNSQSRVEKLQGRASSGRILLQAESHPKAHCLAGVGQTAAPFMPYSQVQECSRALVTCRVPNQDSTPAEPKFFLLSCYHLLVVVPRDCGLRSSHKAEPNY